MKASPTLQSDRNNKYTNPPSRQRPVSRPRLCLTHSRASTTQHSPAQLQHRSRGSRSHGSGRPTGHTHVSADSQPAKGGVVWWCGVWCVPFPPNHLPIPLASPVSRCKKGGACSPVLVYPSRSIPIHRYATTGAELAVGSGERGGEVFLGYA